MEASSQRFHLNDLSGRADMSILQAQTLLQVRFQCAAIIYVAALASGLPPSVTQVVV